MEVWENIKEYEGLYQVSNYGGVKSLKKSWVTGRGRIDSHGEIFIQQHKDARGYLRVSLSKDSNSKTFKVHRLVAQHFIENTENKPEVNHKNTIKDCNYWWNLEWATSSENQQHAYDNGIHKAIRGDEHANSKLSSDDVVKIRELYASKKYTLKDLGGMYSVHLTTISYIINRKLWAHIA